MGSPFLVAGCMEGFIASFLEGWVSENARQRFTRVSVWLRLAISLCIKGWAGMANAEALPRRCHHPARAARRDTSRLHILIELSARCLDGVNRALREFDEAFIARWISRVMGWWSLSHQIRPLMIRLTLETSRMA